MEDINTFNLSLNNDIAKASLYNYNDNRKIFYIANLNVKKEHRRKGYGLMLLKALESMAKSSYGDVVMLRCLRKSWKYNWYKREGYVDYQSDDNKYIWMVKKI